MTRLFHWFFKWKMVPMSGCDIRIVFTLPPRDSTLHRQYKRVVHLWNNFPCFITLDSTNFKFINPKKSTKKNTGLGVFGKTRVLTTLIITVQLVQSYVSFRDYVGHFPTSMDTLGSLSLYVRLSFNNNNNKNNKISYKKMLKIV